MVAVIAGFFLILGALLLLLACMNVANVLLARATVRQREMGLRAALGAGRGRLIRQMLTETILLGLLGGVLGVILGEWANPGDLSKLVSTSLPVRLDFSFDWHVFAYSFAAALFTGVFVGLWPALRASRADLNSILQEGGRSDAVGSRPSSPSQRAGGRAGGRFAHAVDHGRALYPQSAARRNHVLGLRSRSCTESHHGSATKSATTKPAPPNFIASWKPGRAHCLASSRLAWHSATR